MHKSVDFLNDYTSFHQSPHSKVWDKGNEVLYGMCRRYPNHGNIDEIIAKIWLIGRSYAAAIERRKNKKNSNDNFYVQAANEIRKFGFDEKINNIPNIDKLDEDNVRVICEAHFYITKKFHKLTGQYKRSLASKYLHFHRPLVPIYDSRAARSVSGLIKIHEFLKEPRYRIIFDTKKPMAGDPEYTKFIKKIFLLQKFLLENKCRYYTIRDIDKYLVEIQEKKSRHG